MSRIIQFGPPLQSVISIEDADAEMRKRGIPESGRAAALEVARAFDARFKIPDAVFRFRLPDGLTDEQAAAIEARIYVAAKQYHDAWHMAVLNFSCELQDEAILAALRIRPKVG